ncbi:MAG TPA: vitamin K epoxide reductase family protein [Chlamydiales bacterium]|nr:vitamin K epoxide reductase family protein [Chlamydiales bacterium]
MILGLWLIAAPDTFHFQSRPLMINNWISGALLIALGAFARKKPAMIWIGLMGAIGIWLQLTPVIFWAPQSAAYLNDTLIGSCVIFFVLILYPMPERPDLEKSIPPGWTSNPSAWPARIVIAFLAFVCWMISRYLASFQLGYIDTVWDPFFSPGTKAVLESKVSKAFPVSDAGLGAFAYTLEFFSACLGGESRWRTAPWAVLIFGVLVIPVSLVSVVLIILQPIAVKTWCAFCLLTALCMLVGIPFAISEVAATLSFLFRSKEKPLIALLFRGGACEMASADTTTPALDSSWRLLWKSAASNVSAPWNLLVSILLGVSLMAAPAFFSMNQVVSDVDPIAGALSIVVSVIAMSKLIRFVHYANCVFGIWILVQLFWLDTPLACVYHAGIGGLLIGLCFCKQT